jgi:exopolysaccharide biosynthesis polyprenyl glycosylphosphotransferase
MPGPFVRRPTYDPFTARRRPIPQWLVTYTSGVVAGDLAAAVTGATLTMVGGAAGPVRGLLLALVPAWPLVLLMLGTYAERRFGSGADEFRRVLVAGLVVLGGLSVVTAVAPGIDIGGLALAAVLTTVLLTVLGRGVARRILHRARRRGSMRKRILLVGRDAAVAGLARRLRRDPEAGYDILGACVPRPGASRDFSDVDVEILGDLDQVTAILDQHRADAVVVASASETAAEYLRELAWRLEGTKIELLVVPGLIEVSADRLQIRPTISLPLLHVREPEFRGLRRVVKSVADRVMAAALLVLTLPVFLSLALLVRLDSPGAVFYRHRRIGMRGNEFDLLKFRSMVVDADRHLEKLIDQSDGNAVQFKMRRDPRITRVGAFLRRYSLDEIPQLINVLKGDMSLVGPRPHVDREVAQYGDDMYRRLLVKPGITGLWQVSGRSDLSWDESVELDVRYVENWSLTLDVRILWRTARAVFAASGAY